METKWLKEALRRAEERVDDLENEKNDALRQLKSYKEVKKTDLEICETTHVVSE